MRITHSLTFSEHRRILDGARRAWKAANPVLGKLCGARLSAHVMVALGGTIDLDYDRCAKVDRNPIQLVSRCFLLRKCRRSARMIQ